MEWKTEEDIMEDQAIRELYEEYMALSDQLVKKIDRLISRIDNILKEEEAFMKTFDC